MIVCYITAYVRLYSNESRLTYAKKFAVIFDNVSFNKLNIPKHSYSKL